MQKFLFKLSWWIPVKRWRDSFREFYPNYLTACKKKYYNFVLFNGLGDTMLVCGYKKAWEEKYNGKIYFIIQSHHKIIMQMFGITNYTTNQIGKIDDSKSFSIPKKGNLYFASLGKQKQFHEWYLIGDFFTSHRKLLNLDESAIFDKPIWYPSIPKSLKKKMNKFGEIKDVVLFLPEARSIRLLKKQYWDNLVKSFPKNEILIQNVLNPKNLIQNVPNISFTLEELIALAINCKKVYSLRSGFSDLIAYECKNLHVLYNSNDQIKLYSLKTLYNSSATEEAILD